MRGVLRIAVLVAVVAAAAVSVVGAADVSDEWLRLSDVEDGWVPELPVVAADGQLVMWVERNPKGTPQTFVVKKVDLDEGLAIEEVIVPRKVDYDVFVYDMALSGDGQTLAIATNYNLRAPTAQDQGQCLFAVDLSVSSYNVTQFFIDEAFKNPVISSLSLSSSGDFLSHSIMASNGDVENLLWWNVALQNDFVVPEHAMPAHSTVKEGVFSADGQRIVFASNFAFTSPDAKFEKGSTNVWVYFPQETVNQYFLVTNGDVTQVGDMPADSRYPSTDRSAHAVAFATNTNYTKDTPETMDKYALFFFDINAAHLREITLLAPQEYPFHTFIAEKGSMDGGDVNTILARVHSQFDEYQLAGIRALPTQINATVFTDISCHVATPYDAQPVTASQDGSVVVFISSRDYSNPTVYRDMDDSEFTVWRHNANVNTPLGLVCMPESYRGKKEAEAAVAVVFSTLGALLFVAAYFRFVRSPGGMPRVQQLS